MKTIGIIPARYESSRFPGKPLADIHGKPMIQRVYEQCRKAESLDQIIVATDDDRIADAVDKFEGLFSMTSKHHQSGTDRCAEVAGKMDKDEFDVVINIQGDEPFIQPEQIDQVACLFKAESAEIGTLIKPFDDPKELDNPNRVKVVTDQLGRALYFSRSVIPHNRNGQQNIPYYRHLGMYGYRTNILSKIAKLSPSNLELAESLEQLRWLENGFTIHTAKTTIETPGIDTPEDLEKLLKVYPKEQ